MNQLRGLYRHIRTNQLYFVEGIARDVTNPTKISVAYSQEYDSLLRGTNTKLPAGSMWIRDYDDFVKKFEKVDYPRLGRFFITIRSSLQKDIMTGHNLD